MYRNITSLAFDLWRKHRK